MDRQKSRKRAFFVASIIAFILGFILYMVFLAYLTDNDFIFALLSGGFCFAAVWYWYFMGLHKNDFRD
jgi:FtsH-binding integral membrane protein